MVWSGACTISQRCAKTGVKCKGGAVGGATFTLGGPLAACLDAAIWEARSFATRLLGTRKRLDLPEDRSSRENGVRVVAA
jgi:hypothetical protein